MLTHMARMLTRMTRWLAGLHIIDTRPQPAALLLSSLIGSTLHVDNKTNEQSTFKITSIWVQNI